jgi:hypothetical protein
LENSTKSISAGEPAKYSRMPSQIGTTFGVYATAPTISGPLPPRSLTAAPRCQTVVVGQSLVGQNSGWPVMALP